MINEAKGEIATIKYREELKEDSRRSRCNVEPRQRIANFASTELFGAGSGQVHADALPNVV
jgi:hypothetical protein